MDTFTTLREFVENPRFGEQRQESLRVLDIRSIDEPITDIVGALTRLPYCFSLQSCYGHFLYDRQQDERNVEPLPLSRSADTVEYRLAYLALCIENSPAGRALFEILQRIPAIAPECVQFGCADWFWERQVNSYVLQVEPCRFMTKDRAYVSWQEALVIQQVRDRVFEEFRESILKGAAP